MLINSRNYRKLITPPAGLSTGLESRSKSPYAEYGSAPFASKFDIPLIPREEWPDRIADMERTKSSLRDIAEGAGIDVYDQNGTNYCHANSPAFATMLLRQRMGAKQIRLSAASIGGPVTGFRNRGWYISGDLEHLVNYGVCDEKYYPTNHTGKGFWTEEAQANAALHKCTEWFDLEPGPKMFDQVMTLLFMRIPVCVAYLWWRHAVTGVAPKMPRRGVFGIEIGNSWNKTWGDNGYATLEEGVGTPDEAYAPRFSAPSEQ